MKVKITQSPHETWYDRRIGEVFEVLEDGRKYTSSVGEYIVTKAGGVFCADYVEINIYPTLKSNYAK